MPLGGYCEKCQRWVWVSAYGECENGHPADVVRDIQLLTPQSGRGSSQVADKPVVVTGRAKYRWWWRHSLWIIWTFAFGLLSWVAFFYIGVRARSAAWLAAGLMYLLPVVAFAASLGTWWWRIALPVMLAAGALSVAHALAARPKYRAVMFGDVPDKALPAPPQPPPLMSGQQRPALPQSPDVEAREVIAAAHRMVLSIIDAADGIQKPDVRGRVARICGTAEEILAELGREPRQVQLARAFLAYYLEAAQKIVTGYADLSRTSSPSPQAAATLARAEGSLDSIQQAFDQQLAALQEHRVIDLDVEVEVLEKTVRMDAGAASAEVLEPMDDLSSPAGSSPAEPLPRSAGSSGGASAGKLSEDARSRQL